MNTSNRLFLSAGAIAALSSFAYFLGYSILNSYLVAIGFGEQAVVPDVLVATQYVIHGSGFLLAKMIERMADTWPQWLLMIAIAMAYCFLLALAMWKKPALRGFAKSAATKAGKLLEIKIVRYFIVPLSAYVGACGLVAIASFFLFVVVVLLAFGSYSGTLLGQSMGREAAASPACISISEDEAKKAFYQGCQEFTFKDGSAVKGFLHFQSNDYLFIESNDGALLFPKGDFKFARTAYHRPEVASAAGSKPLAMK